MFERSQACQLGYRATCFLFLALTSPLLWAQAGASCRTDDRPESLIACATQQAQQSDTDLQLRYGQLMAQAPVDQRAKLRKEHAHWMRERNRHCRNEAAQHEGTRWALTLQHCLRLQNQERLQALKPPSLAQ